MLCFNCTGAFGFRTTDDMDGTYCLSGTPSISPTLCFSCGGFFGFRMGGDKGGTHCLSGTPSIAVKKLLRSGTVDCASITIMRSRTPSIGVKRKSVVVVDRRFCISIHFSGIPSSGVKCVKNDSFRVAAWVKGVNEIEASGEGGGKGGGASIWTMHLAISLCSPSLNFSRDRRHTRTSPWTVLGLTSVPSVSTASAPSCLQGQDFKAAPAARGLLGVVDECKGRLLAFVAAQAWAQQCLHAGDASTS